MEQPTSEDRFLSTYRAGRLGKNIGIYTPYRKINGWTHGQIPGRYWLIGAESGAGKTTMADEILVEAIKKLLLAGQRPTVFYYSFEISKEEKIARWVSRHLFVTRGIEWPSDYILGRIKGLPVTDEHDALVLEAYAALRPVLDCITFVEDPVHPTMIYESLVEHHFGTIGKVVRAEGKEGKKGRILSYAAHDPEHQTFLVMDHVALLGHEAGLTTKGLIDRMSSYAVTLKNIFKLHVLFIQQFSTDLMSTQRNMRKDEGFLTPQRLDFGDSKYTYRDADVVIGLVNPKSYDLPNYRGYDCSPGGLADNFIAAFLMKNRYGPQNKWFPMWLNGLVGTFEHIDGEPDNAFEMEKYIAKTRKFREICQLFSQAGQ